MDYISVGMKREMMVDIVRSLDRAGFSRREMSAAVKWIDKQHPGIDNAAAIRGLIIEHIIETRAAGREQRLGPDGRLEKSVKTWMEQEGVDPVYVGNAVCRLSLKILRDIPYQDYLKTEHWMKVRNAALERAQNRCQLCNTDKEILDVHHRTYQNRGCERAEDVIVLCRICHERHHGKATA